MPSMIQCARCHRSAEAFDEAPLPAPHGDELLAHTCPECFKDWMGTEIMIINEYKLDLGVPRNQDLLNEEMARFLNLPSAGGEKSSGAPPQATPQQAHGHEHGKEHEHGKGGEGGSCC
jgi:Fe-S cluster biosynthesis and repair protein YggX